MKDKILRLIPIIICLILGIWYYDANVGSKVGPCQNIQVFGVDHHEYPSSVGQVYNYSGDASTDYYIIRKDLEVPIAPQPFITFLQTGDQIIVCKKDEWIKLKLNNNPNPILVTPDKSPYTVESTDASPTSFFQKIEKLFSYFKKLYEDSWRNSNQVYTPSDCDSSTFSNGATTKKIGYKGFPLQKEEAQSIREAINHEPGLTPEAKNTLLAALLVMQQEGNWKQEASQLLNGIGTDYYPAVLVKKELNRTK
jgi:hypothetical protein